MNDVRAPHTIWSFQALIIILALSLAHMAAGWAVDAALGKRLQRQLQEHRLERRHALLHGVARVLSFPLSHIDRLVTDPMQWQRIGRLVFVLNSLLWGLVLYLLWRLAGYPKHRRT